MTGKLKTALRAENIRIIVADNEGTKPATFILRVVHGKNG